MRLLLDENLDHRLKRLFGDEYEISTVRERGWSSKENGELISLAQREFDALVTMDRGIPRQQNLEGISRSRSCFSKRRATVSPTSRLSCRRRKKF